MFYLVFGAPTRRCQGPILPVPGHASNAPTNQSTLPSDLFGRSPILSTLRRRDGEAFISLHPICADLVQESWVDKLADQFPIWLLQRSDEQVRKQEKRDWKKDTDREQTHVMTFTMKTLIIKVSRRPCPVAIRIVHEKV